MKWFRRDPLPVHVPSNYFLSVSTLEAHLPSCQAEQACQSAILLFVYMCVEVCMCVPVCTCVHVCACVYMRACVLHVYECTYVCFALDELLDQNTDICA